MISALNLGTLPSPFLNMVACEGLLSPKAIRGSFAYIVQEQSAMTFHPPALLPLWLKSFSVKVIQECSAFLPSILLLVLKNLVALNFDIKNPQKTSWIDVRHNAVLHTFLPIYNPIPHAFLNTCRIEAFVSVEYKYIYRIAGIYICMHAVSARKREIVPRMNWNGSSIPSTKSENGYGFYSCFTVLMF